MAALRQVLKNTAMRTLRATGVYSAAAKSVKRTQSLLILCYHGISLRDEHEWAGHLFITRERFRGRLACLRDLKANVLSLGDALVRLKHGTLPPRSVVITFDDGFYDFLHHAVPVLNEFSFPATLYLTTYYSGLRFPVINLVLDYLLWKSGREDVDFAEQGIKEPLPIRDWRERMEVTRKLLAWFDETGIDTAAKNEFARQVAVRFGIDYDDLLESRIAQILNPDEVAAVARAAIDIQLHTHRHRTPRDRELFLKEIKDNASRIEEITGQRPVHFCYPSGVYANEFLPWLRECGIQSATTCERGFARVSSEPLLLPRVLDDSNMDLIQFEGLVSGLFA
jgi:peptidoglycan/xylan/chitin deacetylase (PgdA/CDA1 family)